MPSVRFNWVQSINTSGVALHSRLNSIAQLRCTYVPMPNTESVEGSTSHELLHTFVANSPAASVYATCPVAKILVTISAPAALVVVNLLCSSSRYLRGVDSHIRCLMANPAQTLKAFNKVEAPGHFPSTEADRDAVDTPEVHLEIHRRNP